MSQRERRDLPQQRAKSRRQQEQPQHKEDVVQTQRHDMVETHWNIVEERHPARRLIPALQRNVWCPVSRFQIAIVGGIDPHLPQNKRAERPVPADRHGLGTVGQRRREAKARGAWIFHIADRPRSDIVQRQHQPFAAGLDADLSGHLRPVVAKGLLERCWGEQAQIVKGFGLRGVVCVADLGLVDTGDEGLKRCAHVKAQLRSVLLHVRDRRDHLVGLRR